MNIVPELLSSHDDYDFHRRELEGGQERCHWESHGEGELWTGRSIRVKVCSAHRTVWREWN